MNPEFKPPFLTRNAGKSLNAVTRSKIKYDDETNSENNHRATKTDDLFTWIAQSLYTTFTYGRNLMDGNSQEIQNLCRVLAVKVTTGNCFFSFNKHHLLNDIALSTN